MVGPLDHGDVEETAGEALHGVSRGYGAHLREGEISMKGEKMWSQDERGRDEEETEKEMRKKEK